MRPVLLPALRAARGLTSRGAGLFFDSMSKRPAVQRPDGTVKALAFADEVGSGGGSTTLTGDVTGSGTGSIATTLATVTSAATKGSATKSATITVDAKGRVTALSESTVTPAWGNITGVPSSVSSLGSATVAPGRLLQVQSGAPAWKIPAFAQLVYGGGEDGALTVDGSTSIVVAGATIAPVGGVYTLTADVDATTITMSGTAVIRTAGFRIRCWKLVGVAGNLIHDNGNAASGTTAGAGLSAAGTLRRTGGAGGAGRTTVGVGSAGTGQSNTWGGAGGTGGGGSPGLAGTVSVPAASGGRNRGGLQMLVGWVQTTSAAAAQAVSGGAGGSSGSNSSGAGTNSGSGGGGAGRVMVFAYECDYAGTVAANGGDGSAATGAGGAGGGGGGGGGEVIFVSEHMTSTPTLSAAGGAPGASVGGQPAATAGSAGTTHFYGAEA